MASYTYESQRGVSDAPYLQITLGNPVEQQRRINCKALLDTGADRTIVPSSLMKHLKVDPTGRAKTFLGLGNDCDLIPYVIALNINDQWFEAVEVWGWNNHFVLLGRDLLNRHCIEFDGLNLIFTFNQ